MKKKTRFDCIITSGQIGSFIAFDSFLTDKEKKNIKKIIINADKSYKFNLKDEKENHQILNLIKNNKFYNKNIELIECDTNEINSKLNNLIPGND